MDTDYAGIPTRRVYRAYLLTHALSGFAGSISVAASLAGPQPPPGV